MLGIAIAVKHPRNARSYARVGGLLDRTLASVTHQTLDDVQVVVVCNETPDLAVRDPRVRLVSVPYPPPVHASGPEAAFRGAGYGAGLGDKAAKLSVAVAALRHAQVSHVMFVDSDDLVSRRLAEFVAGSLDGAGWYSTSGYIHALGRRQVQLVAEGFHKKCGTSAIVRTDLIPVASDLSEELSRDEVLRRCGDGRIVRLLGAHGNWDEELATHGQSMGSLPFPGAVWEIGTGENASGTDRSGRRRTRLTAQISEEFTLRVPDRRTDMVAAATGMTRRAQRRLGSPAGSR